MSEFLAARVPPWQAFKIKKLAERNNQNLGLVLTEAIQIYFSTLELPNELLEQWLEEYRTIENKKDGNALD